MVKIRVFNGPNLNLLGQREPGQYGQRSLSDIMQELEAFAESCGVELDHFQTNSEGGMVDAIQQAGKDGVAYIIINPAGYTHTSVAIRDALLAVDIPSGLCSDTGHVLGRSVHADITVTFIGRKLGQVLNQGPEVCGQLFFSDIGVPQAVYAAVSPARIKK